MKYKRFYFEKESLKDNVIVFSGEEFLHAFVVLRLKVGDEILDIIGPLGQPTHIEKKDGIVLGVGGGVGIAPLHPIVEAHHKAGNKVISILGARDKSLIIMEDMMKKIS